MAAKNPKLASGTWAETDHAGKDVYKRQVREIAGQMGLPEKTIYTRMERLKKKIKKF